MPKSTPDQGKSEPAFRKIWRILRAQILANGFDPAVPLPTEADIAAEHHVSRQTVRRAFLDLVAEGLVTRTRGRGTFAVPPGGRYLRQFGSIDDLLALSTDSQLTVIRSLAPVIDPIAASRLRLGSDRIDQVSFVRQHHHEVFCHTIVSLPPAIGRLVAAAPELDQVGATSPVTVIGLLEGRLSDAISDAEQSITVSVADRDVADALDLDIGDPVLRVDRLYTDAHENAIELAVSHFHPNRYSYRVRLRRSLV